VDSVGVFLWANRAQYAEVSFQTISENDIADIGLPTMQEDIDEDGSSILSSLLPFITSKREPFLCLALVPMTDGFIGAP